MAHHFLFSKKSGPEFRLYLIFRLDRTYVSGAFFFILCFDVIMLCMYVSMYACVQPDS